MALQWFFVFLALATAAYYYLKRRYRFRPEGIKNKRVLITGSSSGIGERLAYEYSKLGARLLLTARREQLLERVAARCKALGAKEVEILAGDMVSSDHQDKLVDLTGKLMGGLDYLILNHAKLLLRPWTDTAEDVGILKDIMDINFVSYVQLASKCLPMLSESKGNIGVVSSAGGKIGLINSTHYCATKFALQGFFSSWRQEMIDKNTGVSITLCVLSFVKTEGATEFIKQSNLNVDTSAAVSPEDTAVAILQSVASRPYEMYYPRMSWILVTMHKLIPGYTEYFLSSMFTRTK